MWCERERAEGVKYVRNRDPQTSDEQPYVPARAEGAQE